jgi:hypothetical protein
MMIAATDIIALRLQARGMIITTDIISTSTERATHRTNMATRHGCVRSHLGRHMVLR